VGLFSDLQEPVRVKTVWLLLWFAVSRGVFLVCVSAGAVARRRGAPEGWLGTRLAPTRASPCGTQLRAFVVGLPTHAQEPSVKLGFAFRDVPAAPLILPKRSLLCSLGSDVFVRVCVHQRQIGEDQLTPSCDRPSRCQRGAAGRAGRCRISARRG